MITNMATVRIFGMICDIFNVFGICNSVYYAQKWDSKLCDH